MISKRCIPYTFLFFLSICYHFIHAQNTVGLLSIDPPKVYEGFNLLYPHNQSTVYLLDNCGEIVHTWEDDDLFRPGNVAYLLENGNLWKTKRPNTLSSPAIGAGGAGGMIELRDWDNNLLWQTTLMDSLVRAHHDIAPLPNGNVLIVSWEKKNLQEIVAMGRDTARYSENELWPDFIIEKNPLNDSIVWEWHAWDHLIQDFDATKEHFGEIVQHPERIDINYDLMDLGGKPDWMHTNSIDYHPELDQILLSVPFFNEIWIIDHSTTTEEARSNTGGRSGKGGDLLYRWGNPRTYGQGTLADQQLFFQHDANWIDKGAEEMPSIAIFNNRVTANRSLAHVLRPHLDTVTNTYKRDTNKVYLPTDFEKTIVHPIPEKMYSNGLSGIQILPNNNYLICVGRQGYSFEMTPNREIVWEYITPLKQGVPVSQGESLEVNDNITFRIKKYPIDYPAFQGRVLNSSGTIELDNDLACSDLSVSLEEYISPDPVFKVFPNPATNWVKIEFPPHLTPPPQVALFDLSGKKLAVFALPPTGLINLSNYSDGIYFIRIGRAIQKITLLRNEK